MAEPTAESNPDSRGPRWLRRASWCALYFLALWPVLASGAYRGWPLIAAQVVAFSGVLCWLLSELGSSRLEWRRSSADVPLALLLLFVLGQAILGNRPLVDWALAQSATESVLATPFQAPWLAVGSVNPGQTIESLLLFGTYVAAYLLVVVLVRRRRQLDNLVRALLAIGGLVAFLGLFDYLTGASRWVLWRPVRPLTRVMWSFVNPDHFGAWLGMGIFLGIGYVLSRRGRGPRRPLATLLASREDRETTIRTYLPVIAVAVMALALIFTLSRGAILGVLLTTIGLLVALARRDDVRRPLVLIAAIGLATLGYALWIGMEPLLQRLAAVQDYHARWLQIVTSLPMMMDFPIFGVGLGAYKDIYTRYQTAALHPGDVVYPYAHNDLLQLIIELGPVGAALAVAVGWAVAADLVWAHLWGRGRCPVNEASGQTAQRHDPGSVGLGLGGVAAVGYLLVHSAIDFSARIPANGIQAALCLGIATVALHTRFSPTGNIHVGLIGLPLKPGLRLALGATAVVLTIGLVALIVRPAVIEAVLTWDASAARAARIDKALRIEPHSLRALEARATLRTDTARQRWKAQPADATVASQDVRRLILSAVDDWRQTVRLVPTDPALHESLAWSEQAAAVIDAGAATHHRRAAISHLQRAVALAPADPFVYASLAAVASAGPEPRRELGLHAARAALEREPGLLAKLIAEVLPDDLTEAEWLAIVPDAAADRARLAAILEDRDQRQMAQVIYERAVKDSPAADAPVMRWLYGRFLLSQGAAREAAELLEETGRPIADNPELWLVLGQARAALGDPRALEAYRRAATTAEHLVPRGAPPPLLFGQAPAPLQGLIADRLGGDARVQPLRYQRVFAQYLVERKRWKDALDEWDKVVAQAPDDAQAHFSRGLALEGLGNLPGALEAYRHTGTLQRRSPAVRTRLAAKLWDLGQYYQAIDEWRGVSAQAPDDLAARLALARALLHVGDRMAAFLEYQKAVRMAPDNTEAQHGFTRLGGLLEPASVAPRP